VDKVLACRDCKKEFKLSDDQQAWFKAQGFQEPKRCKACRDKRKAARPGGAGVAPQGVQNTRRANPPAQSQVRSVGGEKLFNE